MLGIKKASSVCTAGLFKELVYVWNQEGHVLLVCLRNWSML